MRIYNATEPPAAVPAKQPSTQDPEQFLKSIFNTAISMGASDIHFEPHATMVAVRFRIDGTIINYVEHPMRDYDQILNTIKVLCDLDISAHYIPQDGHFEFSMEPVDGHDAAVMPNNQAGDKNNQYHIDVRVSVFPSINGEVIVMRLLNRSTALLTLDELGMDAETLMRLRKILTLAYGIVLITGPTGSGKTTTLYSIMHELRSEDRVTISLEDPVEFHLDWMRQCEIHPERELTYERAMSSILRQDPDMLMVGEIRDPQTAEYAMRSALVSRIVGSTIHANTTIGTIARLLELGIPRSILGHALNGIIAQRLVRKICDSCKEAYTPPDLYLSHFDLQPGQNTVYRGRGCDVCKGTGYKGRVGIFSVLTFDETLKVMVFEQKSLSEIHDYAVNAGMRTLKMDVLPKVLAGITTVEEAVKAI